MSIREDILAGLRAADDCTVGDATPEELVDAYRAEVLAKAAEEAERVGRRLHRDAPLENRSEAAWEIAADLRRMADAAERGEGQ